METTNTKYLLKMVGIVKQLINSAIFIKMMTNIYITSYDVYI